MIPSSITVSGSTYTVTSIGAEAFLGKLLTSISIPASVTSIGDHAIQSCTSLASVTFGAGSQLQSIGENAFTNTPLTSISIPASVTSIGNGAFQFCGYLASVTFGAGIQLQSIGNGVFQFSGLISVSIPSKVTSIGDNAFQSTPLTSISIPASVTSIGNQAFYSCNFLASVTFGAGSQLLSIGNQAFCICNSLASVTFGTGSQLQSIGDQAFQGTPSSIVVTFGSTSIPTMSNPFGISPTTQGEALYQPGTSSAGIATLLTYFTIVQEAPNPAVLCFLEGSKILTKEGYKKIEELKKGDLVKTLSSGYKKIDMIGYKNMWNPASEERIKDQLYVYKKKNMEEVFEDLVLTGCHSVLIDRFETSEKREKVRKLLGGIFITEKKARLPACLDERAEIYKSEGLHTIYHVALENEVYYNSYGIYANGLLVESCSQEYLKELSGMMLKK